MTDDKPNLTTEAEIRASFPSPRYRLVGYDIGTAPDENGGWVHWTDHEAIVARLTAERDAVLAGAVKVKPLVWFEVERSRHGGKYTADGYTIRYIEGLWLLDFSGQSKSIWRFPTIEAAKAAAQADYEARILSALQPDPDARQADLAKAWEMGREDAAGAAKHAGLAFGYERAVQAIRALTPPADLAAKIGGE